MASPDPLLEQLPKERFFDVFDLRHWQGIWYPEDVVPAAMAVQSHFEARDDDVILTSFNKTGVTWLKALCFCIMNKKGDEEDEGKDPLTTNPPISYVRILEAQVYTSNDDYPDLSTIPSPRLFHTHIAYNSLPDSIKNSSCKVVYITRNPKDTLVSIWHFFNTLRTPEQGPYPFDKAFDSFCDGVVPSGPFFDHVLQYWHESLKKPDKILFLKYEDLKRDPNEQVKKLASFLGRSFSKEKDVDKVIGRCELQRLKNLEVNKNGADPLVKLPNSAFFRRGVVGDWKNYLTPEMAEQLDQITRTKLDGSGLVL